VWLVLALIAVAPRPAHAGGYLWLGAEYQVEGNAYRFNLQTRSIDKVISPTATDHWNNMATDGLNVYLSNPSSSVINTHDAYSGALIAPGSYSPALAGLREDGAFANGSLWRITYTGSVMYRTTTAGVVESTFTVPTGCVGIEWVGTTLFVSNYSTSRIGRLTRTNATTWSYAAYPWKGTPPTGNFGALAWDKQADSLYLATGSGLLYTIKVENDSARALLSANLVAAGYPSGGLPDGMGWVIAPAPTGVVPGEAGAATFTLGEPTPNPAREGVRFELSSDRTAPADIGIYDATGRRLRGWTLPALSPGRSSFMWDFHDSRGAVVPAGVYFVRVRSGHETLSRRFTRVE